MQSSSSEIGGMDLNFSYSTVDRVDKIAFLSITGYDIFLLTTVGIIQNSTHYLLRYTVA